MASKLTTTAPSTGELHEGVKLFKESVVGEWFDPVDTEKLSPSDFTYHPVLLPPVECFASIQAAREWVQSTRTALTKCSPALNDLCALDAPPRSPEKHVVIVQSTEFGFNKYQPAGGRATADSSHPVRWEFFQEALEGLRATIWSERFKKTTIIVAVSAVIDYGPLPPDPSRKIRNLAENAVFVFNNKALGFQKISKYSRAAVDNLNTERFFDFHDDRAISREERAKIQGDPDYRKIKAKQLDTPERRQEMTHSIEDFGGFGKRLCVGIGTCLDASFAKFPNTQLILLSSGGAVKGLTRDKHLGSMIVNDAQAWAGGNYSLPTVGEWMTKDRAKLDEEIYRDATLAKIGREYDWDEIRNQLRSELQQTGEVPNEERQAWMDSLPLLPIPGAAAAKSFADAVGTAWPLTIAEGEWYFRQGDYTQLDDSRIICGAARNLPNSRWRLGSEDVLAPMQMHMFRDEREFADVRAVLEDAAQRAGRSTANWQEVWQIVLGELQLTKAQNRPAWEWAQNVARLVEERVAEGGLPEDYPVETEAGGEDMRGTIKCEPCTII